MRVWIPLWFWRGIWVATLLVGLGLPALYAWLPVDGATGDLASFGSGGFRIHRVLEARNNLQPGDVIVRADGHTVDEWLSGAPRGEGWRTGGSVTYEILRYGQVTIVPVELAPIAVETLLLTWTPQLLGALAFFSVGTFVFWKRPYESAARLLMLFGATVALQYWGDAYNFQYGIIPFRWPLWVHVAYEHVTYSLSIATICFFALVFPEPHPLVKRFPRGVPFVIYALHPVAIGAAMALSRGWSHSLVAGNQASWMVALTQIGLALAAAIRSYVTVRDPIQRAQLRWLVWTVAVGATVGIPGYVLPLMIAGRPLLSHPTIMVGLTILPIVLAIIILRYRLFDIEVLIHRSLVYGTLTALLGGMYLFLIPVLTLLVRIVLRRQQDLTVSFAATLCIVAAFNPMRRSVQTLIDRTFYRAKVDYETLLSEMSERLATSIVLDPLSALLTQELPRRLQIAWAELSILEPAESRISSVSQGHHLPSLSDRDRTVEYMREWAKPLIRLDPPPDLPPETSALIEQHAVELLIPLIVGNDLIGLYALGPKLSGSAYHRDDVRLLRILGQQAAVSVQNARLYRQIEAYSRSLEDQVQQRTQQLQDAYRDLSRQHATLNIVLNNIADGLVVTDLERQIILHNPVFLEMVAGLSPHYLADPFVIDEARPDLVGRHLGQVSPDASLMDAIAQAQQFPSTVATVDTTWDQRIYRASSCALGGSDHPVSGVVTVLRDITQEVQMTHMKDEFVSMVSHELRTPLTSIIGFTHLIDRQFRNYLQPRISASDSQGQESVNRVLGNLEIIMDQGDRLTRMINNVLDLARIEAGHMQWEMQRLHIADVIKESVKATQSLANEKGLGVQVQIDDDLPLVYGDRDRLLQVITNLLSNAFKYTDRGTVRVRGWKLSPGDDVEPFSARAPNAELVLPARETCVAVSVQDSGTGIAEADLPHVFERFRQVGDQLSGTKRPGTGLGLPICKQIVEHHGGQIWVESQLGIGSRFVFTLCAIDPFGAE